MSQATWFKMKAFINVLAELSTSLIVSEVNDTKYVDYIDVLKNSAYLYKLDAIEED